MAENLSSNETTSTPLRIVCVGGGLGNQMFLYAFGLAVGDDVLFDTTVFQRNHYRSFDLALYNIEKRFATPEQLAQLKKEIRVKNFFPRFIREKFHMKRWWYFHTDRVEEKQLNRYQPELLSRKGPVFFAGAFQSEKYFKKLRPKLLHDLTLSEPLDEPNRKMLEKIKSSQAIAVHIRRGDYLNKHSPFTYLDKDYFLNAMNYVAERIDNPSFFIFSSDMDWVRDNIKTAYPQTFVDINDEKHGYFDLELMRNCKHNIIANSTFSWWGAWLNPNPDKIVVAPKQWFLPDAAEYSGDIVPDEWIKM